MSVDSSDEINGGAATDDVDARTRRVDGARQPVSESVIFRGDDRSIDGWTLNQSRGGLRAAIEESVDVGDEFEIEIGDASGRPGRVVWVRNQKDGAIVGFAFSDAEGTVPPPPTLESLRAHGLATDEGKPTKEG